MLVTFSDDWMERTLSPTTSGHRKEEEVRTFEFHMCSLLCLQIYVPGSGEFSAATLLSKHELCRKHGYTGLIKTKALRKTCIIKLQTWLCPVIMYTTQTAAVRWAPRKDQNFTLCQF